MGELFSLLETLGAARCFFWSDLASGLRAVAVVDDLRLGPGAGGIRTRLYASVEDAIRDAAGLARAMTLKCALANLEAGGAKIVVLEHDKLDRAAAFARLGERIEELGGLIRTAGDFGTTAADLEAAASRCQYVHRDEGQLSDAVARGIARCIEACAAHRNHRGPLRVAVQGAGNIGAAVARHLHAHDARLQIADADHTRAEALVRELGDRAEVIGPDEVLGATVDVLCPCALGGVLDARAISSIRAWAIVPGANNVLASPSLAERLRERNILFVPDVVASAGAVIEGIGRTVMGLPDRAPLIDELGHTARTILTRAEARGQTTLEIAHALALERLTRAR